jgi:hypothetical protein
MDFRMLDRIERDLRATFPRLSDKVPAKFSPQFRAWMSRLIVTCEPIERDLLLPRIRELIMLVGKGIKAGDLLGEIRSLPTVIPTGGNVQASGAAIARLERQLRDLQTMVTSSSDVDKRFRAFQDQLESLREDMGGSAEAFLTDKQEDMLQKFLAAEKKAFIIMPFQRDFDNVWIGAIKPACVDCHYVPLRVDEVNLSSLITDDIEKYSSMADVVIVDLTGNNPNVMFELGWSLAMDKKPIVICQGDHASKVAFDVRGIRHISYENSWLGVEALKKKIKDFITTTEKHTVAKAPKKPKKPAKKASGSGVSGRKTVHS